MKNKMHTHSSVAISASHSTQSCLENIILLTLISFSSNCEVKIIYFPLSVWKQINSNRSFTSLGIRGQVRPRNLNILMYHTRRLSHLYHMQQVYYNATCTDTSYSNIKCKRHRWWLLNMGIATYCGTTQSIWVCLILIWFLKLILRSGWREVLPCLILIH